MMASEPNYYQILGVEPTADQATIEAAYQGRLLRFRLGQLRDRARAMPGPSQDEIERAFAVLGNREARARYDAVHFPGKATARRRLPAWLWGIAAAWVAAIAVVCLLGARSRLAGDGSTIGQFVATATPPTASSVVAVALPTETPTAAPPTSTPVQVVAPTLAPSPTITIAPTATVAPTTTPTPGPPSLTFRPTATESPVPTATLAPTATIAPTATPEPPTATPEPPPPPEPPPVEPPPAEPPPPPAPTATPTFRPTDRIGTSVPVNLRAGPGTNSAPVGNALAPGTLLAATGERANAGGYLWRRFRVADGRIGWVRDIDVLPVR